jgi:glutamate synthase (NADPH/NADH) large chain
MHSRFSTNTFSRLEAGPALHSWRTTAPEINTLRGNLNWFADLRSYVSPYFSAMEMDMLLWKLVDARRIGLLGLPR